MISLGALAFGAGFALCLAASADTRVYGPSGRAAAAAVGGWSLMVGAVVLALA